MAAIIINFVVLITLGFFAKDNLLAELKPLLSPETSHNNATLPSMGSIEVAFSPKGGATVTIIKAYCRSMAWAIKNQIRYHGCFGPNSKIRELIVAPAKNAPLVDDMKSNRISRFEFCSPDGQDFRDRRSRLPTLPF